jgi:hypothetical protein
MPAADAPHVCLPLCLWLSRTRTRARVCSSPHIIQSQLQQVLASVVYSDYPQAWPGLLEAVMGHLTSNVGRADAEPRDVQRW